MLRTKGDGESSLLSIAGLGPTAPYCPPDTGLFFPTVLAEAEMPFQVVELRLDANDKVIDRRAIPYPYGQHLDAVETIKKLIKSLKEPHHDAGSDCWSAIAKDGKARVKFIIEGI